MASTLTRWRFFLSSFAPLFLILALRFDDVGLRVACSALCALGVLSLQLQLWHLRRSNTTPMRMDVVRDLGAEVAGYAATYLLPFVAAPEPTAVDILTYGLFLFVIGIIYIRSNMVQINPLLYLLGYRVWSVRSDGWDGFLISKTKPKEQDVLLVSRLVNTFALDRADARSVDPEP